MEDSAGRDLATNFVTAQHYLREANHGQIMLITSGQRAKRADSLSEQLLVVTPDLLRKSAR